MHRFVLIVAAVLAAGCAEEAASPADAMRAAAPELAHLPAREDTSGGAYLQGRVAILQSVDTTRAGYVPVGGYELYTPLGLYDDRGRDILATTLDEVGTVARLDCAFVESTSYDEQGGTRAALASRQACDMTLVDRSIPAVIHRHRFMGPELPASVSVDATSSLSVLESPVSMTDVLGYLEGLPRR